MSLRKPLKSMLRSRSRKGFRGYPIATVAFYGPDAMRASKVAVGIAQEENSGVTALERWFSPEVDVRMNADVGEAVLNFIKSHNVRSVVMTETIVGCPHEEGIDYPEGATCPQCPYWANRDRWTGKMMQ